MKHTDTQTAATTENEPQVLKDTHSWNVGSRYTVIGISDVLAMTTKTEIKVVEIDANREPIFVLRGKRKRMQFRDGIGRDKLLFEGWDIPLKTDSDQQGSFVLCGNACFNFLGFADEVRDYIEKENLNEYFARHDWVLAHGDRVLASGDSAVPVYPQAPTTHAVVKRIRNRLGLKEAPEVVSSYSREQAVADGVLMGNPRRDAFFECDVITTNLWNRLTELAAERNKKRIESVDENHLLGCLMLAAKEAYACGNFRDDNDKDFFAVPANAEGITVWFVRNEAARLTAMLPEDY